MQRDMSIANGKAMLGSILTLTTESIRRQGEANCGRVSGIYYPLFYLRHFDGPSCSIVELWRTCQREGTDRGLVVGTIIQPTLDMQPKTFGEACSAFCPGGDFTNNEQPQSNQSSCRRLHGRHGSIPKPEALGSVLMQQRSSGCCSSFGISGSGDEKVGALTASPPLADRPGHAISDSAESAHQQDKLQYVGRLTGVHGGSSSSSSGGDNGGCDEMPMKALTVAIHDFLEAEGHGKPNGLHIATISSRFRNLTPAIVCDALHRLLDAGDIFTTTADMHYSCV